jgi:AcrR family transcriptional regulator
MTAAGTRHESKTRLLSAALHVIRAKGYSATRIEDICAAAGLTKGSFFHHFDSKEALALAAADYWIEGSDALFASAPYRNHTNPLDRLLAYVDFRKALLMGELPDFTCLAGTMVQEVYDTHPALLERLQAAGFDLPLPAAFFCLSRNQHKGRRPTVVRFPERLDLVKRQLWLVLIATVWSRANRRAKVKSA